MIVGEDVKFEDYGISVFPVFESEFDKKSGDIELKKVGYESG